MFELCSKESERIVYTITKNLIDSALRSQFIDSSEVKTTADIINKIDHISLAIQPESIITACQTHLTIGVFEIGYWTNCEGCRFTETLARKNWSINDRPLN